jgi:alpha-L-rhamnosidase
VFDLLPGDDQRATAGRRLAELVAADGYHISTGFVGTPVICEALARTGHVDAAYRILLQEECPSWLYPVSMGATTVWERWDSMLPDGSINPGDMTSFNHYALGAVADFLHTAVAGLRRLPTGRPEYLFAPLPGGGLTHATATHLSPWGPVSCGWRLTDGIIEMTVDLPAGLSGCALVPGETDPVELGPGRHVFTAPIDERVVTNQAHRLARLVHEAPLPL